MQQGLHCTAEGNTPHSAVKTQKILKNFSENSESIRLQSCPLKPIARHGEMPAKHRRPGSGSCQALRSALPHRAENRFSSSPSTSLLKTRSVHISFGYLTGTMGVLRRYHTSFIYVSDRYQQRSGRTLPTTCCVHEREGDDQRRSLI